jgi:ribosomal protein S18 acetylase RimI-like enzyme
MNVEIIPITMDDADALVAIQKEAFKRLYDIYHDKGSPYLRGSDEIALWMERPNWQVYKIIADGVLCGGVSFCERDGMPGVYYLARIYVLPKFQGKAIAGAAILLCEMSVANANLWTLDFPVNETSNRRCYEKAGYIDTGERSEQSEGAITLAYMEKTIPAFRDMKNHLNNPAIHKILSYSLFDCSPEGIAKKVAIYRGYKTHQFYGWVEKGDILGLCGFEVHPDFVEILHISVEEKNRHSGIGKAMVNTLRDKYKVDIKAETDDDAVDFYRKCGFGVTAIYKHYGNKKIRRYICVLPFTALS